jgi:hypothetical protein
VLLDFSTATLLKYDKAYNIKTINILSQDEKVKNIDPESCREKITSILLELKQKKDADNAAEYQKRVDARKAPVDMMKNPELTKSALTCLNNHATKEQYGYSFTKAYIISEDWTIYKHQYTGAILKRTIEVAVVFKKEGKCFSEYFAVGQDYAGAGFQKTLFYDGVLMKADIGGDEIDCNKLK